MLQHEVEGRQGQTAQRSSALCKLKIGRSVERKAGGDIVGLMRAPSEQPIAGLDDVGFVDRGLLRLVGEGVYVWFFLDHGDAIMSETMWLFSGPTGERCAPEAELSVLRIGRYGP